MYRNVVKTASYSVMHLLVAVSVAYALSGDWRIALSIGLVEPLVQTVAYAVHERVWTRIGFWRRTAEPA
ncbi:MAG: DUF2061 domain-containing protein [Alphaproteobacteria bacterium]|nr:DUF2061 domain-containing protein [Alphaproteobacteria bacterium]